METIFHTFENSGTDIYNDVVFERIFDLERNYYSIEITPSSTTRFWRLGIRLSKTENIEFFHPQSRYKEPEFKDYIDIHLAVGEWDNQKWEYPNKINLAQYNLLKPENHILSTSITYKESEKVNLNVSYFVGDETIYVGYKAMDVTQFARQYKLDKAFRYFKVFAWADAISFRLDCGISITSKNETSTSSVPITSKTLINNKIRYDQIIKTLIDGNEEQRSDLLHQIHVSNELDRAALSKRLRKEIENNFSPGKENDFAKAIRDPKKISSIRSWMLSCLIYNDVEDVLNRPFLMQHLMFINEPDENVRYWTLAGLFQQNASYLSEAIEFAKKNYPSVDSNLAGAIETPNDITLIEQFRKNLHSDNFEKAWQVLRILRVVAIPELADDIYEILENESDSASLAYDAFYALTNPPMIAKIVKKLEINPGTKSIVDRLITVIGDANLNGARNLVHILLPFDKSEVDKAISEAKSNIETRLVANQITDYLNQYRGNGTVSGVYVAGYAADTINVDHDYLDIQEDVMTLTAVMIAKEVPPPIAIGLFGDWGTGKSFFMKSIQNEIIKLQKNNINNPNSQFCRHTVQIEFNAWHYVETNLWASLVSSIFQKLALHVSPQSTIEQKQNEFLSELESTKSIVKEAELEQANLKLLIEGRELELKNLQIERENKKISLKDLKVEDISKLLSPEQNKELNDGLEEIGVPAAMHSINELNTVVNEVYTVKGRLTGLFLSIINSKNKWFTIIVLLCLFVFIPLGGWYIHKRFDVDRIVATIGAFITEAVGAITFFVVVLRQALTKLKGGIKKVETVKARVDNLIKEKRKNPSAEEVNLESEIALLNVKEKEEISRLNEATNKLAEIDQRLKTLKEEYSLPRFLAERTSSNDYRNHLGLISIIRQDFEALTDRLARANNDENDRFKRVDRIILYIDDLDRCPTEKVIEVLQAVHLLLAYPLFVVVVGVDPRWLIHSLEKKHSAFQNDGEIFGNDEQAWRTTPQNFLEKIFQIPFNLRRMTNNGFDKLMEGLLTPEISTPYIVPKTENNTDGNKTKQEKIEGLGTEISKSMKELENIDIQHSDVKPGNIIPLRYETRQALTKEFKINEDSLKIKSWETNFAKKLGPMISTPRSAKRFSNIYRILKASVPIERLGKFEGSAEIPGEFQIPMLLLSILTGYPSEAAILFPYILKNIGDKSEMKELLLSQEVDTKSQKLIKLKEHFNTILDDPWFPTQMELYSFWIPKVSRFSFELNKIEVS